MVLRDYPSDSLSLRASAIIWQHPVPHSFMEKAFITPWLHDEKPNESLDQLKNLAKLDMERAKKSLQPESAQGPLLKKIFDQREKDKKNFGIYGLPLGIMVHHNAQGQRIITILDLSKDPILLMEEIEKNRNSTLDHKK